MQEILTKISVPSHTTKDRFYTITLYKDGDIECNCPSFIYRKGYKQCKHIRQNIATLTNIVSKKSPTIIKKIDVASHTREDIFYCVSIHDDNKYSCTCPDYTYRNRDCKHIKQIY